MSTTTVAGRFVVLFMTPRWRLACFIGAVIWAVVFNILYIQAGDAGSWWGPISVVPIWALTADTVVRSYRLQRGNAPEKNQD